MIDETLASLENRYVREVVPLSCEKCMFQICYVASELSIEFDNFRINDNYGMSL